jgi:hypothetical protein
MGNSVSTEKDPVVDNTAEPSDIDPTEQLEKYLEQLLQDESITTFNALADKMQVLDSRFSDNNQALLGIELSNRRKSDNYLNTDYGVADRGPVRHFAGYKQWRDVGRQVQAGSDGFTILVPKTGLACPHCGHADTWHGNHPDLDCPYAGDVSEEINTDSWHNGVYYFIDTSVFAYQQTKPREDVDEDEMFTAPKVEAPSTVDSGTLFTILANKLENGELDQCGPVSVNMEIGIGLPGVSGNANSTANTINIAQMQNNNLKQITVFRPVYYIVKLDQWCSIRSTILSNNIQF